MKGYFLKPGYIFFAMDPTMILSVLGPSVAITLYDPFRRVGGMNHFIHPELELDTKPTALYAQPATLQLIRMFRKSGSSLQGLQAQLFGGSSRHGSDQREIDLGRRNIDMAKEMLDKYNIPVIGQDVGGPWGRKLVFNSQSGEVVIAKVEKIREADWNPAKGLNWGR